MVGKYIVIEGIDGTGKSTIQQSLLTKLTERKIDTVTVHEPGDTPIGEAIRQILKNPQLERQNQTELMLFTAARIELWPIIRQHLDDGKWVISDRNFLSSIVYQGWSQGELAAYQVTKFLADNLDKRYLKPDLTVILDSNLDTAKQRLNQRDGNNQDAIESRGTDYYNHLIKAYRQLATDHHLPLIDSSRPIDKVFDDVWQQFETIL